MQYKQICKICLSNLIFGTIAVVKYCFITLTSQHVGQRIKVSGSQLFLKIILCFLVNVLYYVSGESH